MTVSIIKAFNNYSFLLFNYNMEIIVQHTLCEVHYKTLILK